MRSPPSSATPVAPTSVDQLVEDAFAREATSATGLPGGIAIPHCRTTGVEVPTLAFARLEPPVDFGAKDGPADLAFLIAAPAGGDADHLTILTKLARALVKPAFTDALRAAETDEEVVDLIAHELGEPAAGRACRRPSAATAGSHRAGQPPPRPLPRPLRPPLPRRPRARSRPRRGHRLPDRHRPHLHGRRGPRGRRRAGRCRARTSRPRARPARRRCRPRPSPQAGAVIFAVDVGVRDRSRFAGKPMVSSGVKRPIDDADAMIAEALRYAADPRARRASRATGQRRPVTRLSGKQSFGATARRVLMTGVSYMIPFVAAGGLLIALGFLLGGYEIVNRRTDDRRSTTPSSTCPTSTRSVSTTPCSAVRCFAYLGALLFMLGGAAFGFLVPALAGYIAYAIADRPGIAPGFVMGAIAGTLNSGFLGGIVGGVLAGIIALWIAGWKVPTWVRGLMPVLVIPLLTTLICRLRHGRRPRQAAGRAHGAASATASTACSGGSAILLGVILGLMMAFDMGGPLNKTAYAFATTGLGAAATATDAPELQDHGRGHARRHGAAARAGAGHRRPSRPVHRPRARERQGRLAAGRLLHHRGRHPVRRGRPAARHPLDHGRQRRHRCPVDGPRRQPARPARRHLRALRRRRRARLPHRPGRRRPGERCARRRAEEPRALRRPTSLPSDQSTRPTDQPT